MKILYGTIIAFGLLLIPATASLTGIASWKILLAAIGVVLFVLGGRTSRS